MRRHDSSVVAVKANKSDSGSGGGDKETEGEKVDKQVARRAMVVLAGCGQRGMGRGVC